MAPSNQPVRPEGLLAGLLYDVRTAVRAQSLRANPYRSMAVDDLNALDELRSLVPSLAEKCQIIEDGLRVEISSSQDEQFTSSVNSTFRSALHLALPATQLFLKWCHATREVADHHSLQAIHLHTLRQMEVDSHSDKILQELISDFHDRLRKVTQVGDVIGFAQVFENYSEAAVYVHLKDRLSSVKKIDEKSGKVGSTPDFECTLDDLTFFVEVKSLDIVDAHYRARELMDDSVNSNIHLEAQLKAGAKVAMSERVLQPFKKSFRDAEYDPRCLKRVIETLQSKARSAFKSSQFQKGPTFALAVTTRLLIPGGEKSVRSHYVEDYDGNHAVSGVLWQACYGRTGGTITRIPMPPEDSIEGYLDYDGLYVDTTRLFPGVGFIAFDGFKEETKCYGLCGHEIEGWSTDNTTSVLRALCVTYSDNNEA